MAAAHSVLSGQEDAGVVISNAAPVGATAVDVQDVAQRLLATAIANWQLSAAAAPSNQGLMPQKMNMNGPDHYCQIPSDPIGTFVFFHGCNHVASHSWPYDPASCPECLGLPEEVAHTKQALAWGYAVLVPESKAATGCFSSSSDATLSDQTDMPYIIQAFLRDKFLETKPVLIAGISAGAAFAVKLPKTLLATTAITASRSTPPWDYDYALRAEVNAIDWSSWGLLNSKGQLRYPGFPPVAYVQMERDLATAATIQANIPKLRGLGINSDYVLVPSRPINESWFSDRSPAITPQQSSAIVAALQQLGVLDSAGWLRDDPRVGLKNTSSPL
ncbi:hypothetical protein ABPG75_008666 [Micractinium tetrahymenae]